MRKALSRHAPTLLIGALAIVLATALSATAALVVTSKNIKNGTIKNKDIHSNTIKSNKIRNGTLVDKDLSADLLASLTGGAGPAGPAGPKGDPGAKGDKGDPGTSGYEVAVAPAQFGAVDEVKTLTAPCPAGKVAVGGGGGTFRGSVTYSRPVVSDGHATGWEVRAKLGPTTPPPFVLQDQVTAYAICMSIG